MANASPVAGWPWHRLGELSRHQDGEWVEVHTDQGHLAFQQIEHYLAEPQVLALGATKTDKQTSPDQFRVFLDPAGHPFCLVRPYAAPR